jgi:DNA repair protein RecN (Recombination protein N)
LKKVLQKSALRELTIRSLGVIDSAEVDFKDGLTVITGETGAGKTMVLTALNLILGSKSDADFVRSGDDRLVVSGKFNIGDTLQAIVEDAGGFVEDGDVIINRSVTNQGKSKISLGGAVTTTSQVSDLAQELVEIHAQSSPARLSKPAVQLNLLDSYGDYQDSAAKYSDKFIEFNLIRKRVADLTSQLKVRDFEIAKLTGFVDDFAKIAPKKGELDQIENEITKLEAVEELNAGLIQALGIISGEDESPTAALGLTKKILENLKGKDSELDLLIEKYSELIYEFSENSSGLERYLAGLGADPARFDYLQNRKSELNGLLKKYGEGSDRESAYENLLIAGGEASSRLEDLQGGDSKLAQLQNEGLACFDVLKDLGLKLSASRANVAKKLSVAITSEMALLAMPNAKLSVQVTTSDGSKPENFSATGLDEVLFLFTSHTDGKLLPLAKAASGGELSRVMLSIEVVLAKNSPVGTYIFDEVDAGVGGKAAIEVGKRLALLAQNSQVIVVTHLAQVASWADNHFVVSKNESGSVTQSNILEVSGAERRKEIARLLSGQEDSKTAQEHAGELLDMVAVSRSEMIG